MRARLLLSVALSALLAAPPASAQTAPAEAADSSSPDIVVTANKREQSIIDVDSSITALSGEDLVAGGIQDTQTLVNATPNLIVQRSIIGKIHIRGVGNENYTIGGDPSVAIHSDGVYVARAAAGLFDFFDIARVEVLRGPQGTLYGRNATGGVINVIPRTPTDELEGYGSFEYGNYDHIRLEGAVSGPLGGGLSARISGLGLWRDGFIRNVNPQARARGLGRLDSKELWAVRGQLAYDNDGPVRARLNVEYIHDNSNLPAYVYVAQPAPFLPQIPAGRRTIDQGYELELPILGGTARSFGTDADVFKSNQLGVALHIDVDLGETLTLSSISGFRNTKFNHINDGDGTSAFFVNYGQQDDSDQYSQELRLASDNDGPFNWLLGGYYFQEESKTFIALPIRLSIFGLPDDSITVDGTAETDAYAIFGEIYYQLSDQFKVTLGGRYSHEKRRADYIYKALFAGPVNAPLPTADDATPGTRTFNNFAPKVVLTWEPNPDTNIYAGVSRGFKSGGFNLLAIQPGFDPETIWNYEAGVKSRLADGRVRVGASVFYSDFKDLQVGQIVNLQSVLTNAAQAEIYGIEADIEVQATDEFEFGAAAAYLHAEFTDFCTDDPTQPTAAAEPGCSADDPINLSGFRLPRAPRFTASGWAAYSFDLGNAGALTARGDVRYQSLTFFTQFNRPEVAQDGYVVANARLTWVSQDERFSVGAWVNNLFDKFYYTELLESGAFNPALVVQSYPAPPRTYGLTLGAKF